MPGEEDSYYYVVRTADSSPVWVGFCLSSLFRPPYCSKYLSPSPSLQSAPNGLLFLAVLLLYAVKRRKKRGLLFVSQAIDIPSHRVKYESMQEEEGGEKRSEPLYFFPWAEMEICFFSLLAPPRRHSPLCPSELDNNIDCVFVASNVSKIDQLTAPGRDINSWYFPPAFFCFCCCCPCTSDSVTSYGAVLVALFNKKAPDLDTVPGKRGSWGEVSWVVSDIVIYSPAFLSPPFLFCSCKREQNTHSLQGSVAVPTHTTTRRKRRTGR